MEFTAVFNEPSKWSSLLFLMELLTKISSDVPLLPWATKNQTILMFVMRPLETYFGGGVKVWKTSLKEGVAQNAQLKLLRQRYLNEIIRFELNTVQSEVMRKSAEYKRKSLTQNRDLIDEIARLQFL